MPDWLTGTKLSWIILTALAYFAFACLVGRILDRCSRDPYRMLTNDELAQYLHDMSMQGRDWRMLQAADRLRECSEFVKAQHPVRIGDNE